MSLEVEGVSAAYGANGGVSRPVLRGVSLTVQPGEVVGLLGPNGAGKSTLIKVITKTLKPLEGTVTLRGRELSSYGRFELARELAVVEQKPVLPRGFSVREVVAMGRTPHLRLFGVPSERDRLAVEDALDATELSGLAKRRVETLSGGEVQRVIFARALAQQPRHLLLDEPTSHLDLKYQVELLQYARQQARGGVGVLVVMHDLNLAARSCDRLLMLSAGLVVAEGRPEEVLDEGLIKRVYGAHVRVGEIAGAPVVVPLFEEEGSRSSAGPQ